MERWEGWGNEIQREQVWGGPAFNPSKSELQFRGKAKMQALGFRYLPDMLKIGSYIPGVFMTQGQETEFGSPAPTYIAGH